MFKPQIKIVKIIIVFITFFIFCQIFDILYNYQNAMLKKIKMLKNISSIITNVLGLNIEYINLDLLLENNKQGKGVLFVANHFSYLDVLVLAKVIEARFVTSEDYSSKGIAGVILRKSSPILVERIRYFSRLIQDINTIKETLYSGINVALFPEGTTSDGNIRQFKSSLFQAAVLSQSFIQPVCIEYQALDGNSQKEIISNEVHFINFAPLIPHIINLVKYNTINAKVTFLKSSLSDNRKEVSKHCHLKIKKNLTK